MANNRHLGISKTAVGRVRQYFRKNGRVETLPLLGRSRISIDLNSKLMQINKQIS